MSIPSKWGGLSESQAAQYHIDEIQFSGSTYQIHVLGKDSSDGYWVFLQFDASDQVKDAFCSCSEEDCLHLLAAYRHIYPEMGAPYHKRYANSLWRELTFRIAKKIRLLDHFFRKEKERGSISYTSLSGKVLFSIRGKNKRWKELLHQMVEEREEESEENSLKFSNLSKEEMEAWRLWKTDDCFAARALLLGRPFKGTFFAPRERS